MANHTLEKKTNDWWRLHLPLVVRIKLTQLYHTQQRYFSPSSFIAPELPEPTDRLTQASPRWVVEGHAMRQGIDRGILVILEVSGYFNRLKIFCHLKNFGGIVVILEVLGVFWRFLEYFRHSWYSLVILAIPKVF